MEFHFIKEYLKDNDVHDFTRFELKDSNIEVWNYNIKKPEIIDLTKYYKIPKTKKCKLQKKTITLNQEQTVYDIFRDTTGLYDIIPIYALPEKQVAGLNQGINFFIEKGREGKNDTKLKLEISNKLLKNNLKITVYFRVGYVYEK